MNTEEVMHLLDEDYYAVVEEIEELEKRLEVLRIQEDLLEEIHCKLLEIVKKENKTQEIIDLYNANRNEDQNVD